MLDFNAPQKNWFGQNISLREINDDGEYLYTIHEDEVESTCQKFQHFYENFDRRFQAGEVSVTGTLRNFNLGAIYFDGGLVKDIVRVKKNQPTVGYGILEGKIYEKDGDVTVTNYLRTYKKPTETSDGWVVTNSGSIYRLKK